MQKNSSQNAKIRQQEVKLFIYFFVLTGVLWIFEIISSYVGIVSDYDHCYARLFLDIPNLLAGLVIFLATVCRLEVYRGIKAKIMKKLGKDRTTYTKISILSSASRTKNSVL